MTVATIPDTVYYSLCNDLPPLLLISQSFVEIDRYCFFGADTYIVAIMGR